MPRSNRTHHYEVTYTDGTSYVDKARAGVGGFHNMLTRAAVRAAGNDAARYSLASAPGATVTVWAPAVGREVVPGAQFTVAPVCKL